MGDESQLLCQYSPHQESLHNRYFIYKLLKSSIYRALEKKLIKVTVYGSLPLRTFLQEGDIDITVITTPEEYLCNELMLNKIKSQLLQEFEIRNIQEIQAEVPILKVQVFNINVDISINQIGGVRSLIFLEEISRLFPKHLLKKSILITKAWGTYFSRILGSQVGLLGTYALEVLIVFILNTVPSCRTNTLQVLKTLIEYFSEFDWENWIVTCVGVVPVQKWRDFNEEECGEKLQLSGEKVKKLRSELRCGRTDWTHKFVNVADPVLIGNNLGKRVSFQGFQRIKLSFKVAAELIKEFGVERLFKKIEPQVGIECKVVEDGGGEKSGVAISYFANIRKLKEALYSCLAVMDPSFPQNY